MALGSGNIQINVGASGLTDDIVRQVRTAEKKIRPMSVSLNERGFREPLGRISGDMAEFQKSLDASVARTLAFGAAVGVLNAVTQGFKAMIVSAIEVEKTLTDINVILNLNTTSLAEFSSKLFETAKNTGQSFQTVSEAAIELSRQGLGAEDTLGRINDAMILTRLSGMDAAKSVETLTAAVNSFGDTAITTTEIVNKLATVDAAFAVSTEDLANGLARAGATAQSAKVDLNELLAAVTSVQQTTARGGAVIGNAFKSIFTRLQRGGVREALEEIGVATTDAAGNIRGALDVLQDYSGVYGSLTDSQKSYTDELIAGVFQINNLKALVKDLGSDYSIYERALDKSNNATDEAVRRNEKLQGTLSSLVNEASLGAKELASSLGNLLATPAIENLLTLFNSISGALTNALDPEKGSKLIQGMFKAIGGFIAGPGLILIGVAFVKIFKFITGQSLKAVKEIFKIGSATNKIAETEAKIGFLLKNNKSLYEAISNSALSHEQKEELVLRTIQKQNAAYTQQQKLISRISSSRAIGSAVRSSGNASGFIPARAKGYVPNFANGVEGAMISERAAISAGEGGASRSAKPKVLKNFPMGGGRNQTIVANTDEVIVPKYGGSSGSAIFNKDMIKKSGGVPDGAIPVANGYIPNFASSLEKDKDYRQFLQSQDGLDIDVERQLGGFGMLSAKGVRGRKSSSLKQISAFTPVENNSIIEKISGSKLTKDDKKFISTIIAKKRTTFSNIGTSSITEMSSPEVSSKVEGKAGAINDIIQPNIANAVASVASRIYNGILGDEVGAGLVSKVRKQADVDKSIVSPSVEGGIFESALRLGSLESAKNLGKNKHDGIWDFEETGPITKDMQDIFFQGYGISRGDAKRSGGAQSLREVVQKSHKSHFKEPLETIYEQHWKPFFEAGNKMTKGERSKGRKKGEGVKKAGGFIPNYVFQDNNGLSRAAMKSQPKTGSQFNVSDILNITRRSDQDKKDFKKQFPKKKLLPHLIKNLRNEKYRNVINNNFARDKDARTNFGRTHYPSITEGDFKSKSKEYGIVGNAAAYIYSNSSRKTPDWSSKIENLGKEKGRSIVRPKLKNYIKEPHYGFDSISIRPPEANSTEIGFREIQERIKQYLGKNIPKTGKGNINIGDVLDSDKDIFPKTSAKIDDNWRNNYSKILDNNKDYYIKQIEAYNKGSKSTSTGRIFEELLNSGLKAYNQEMTYQSRLDNDNWDLYNITQKEQEVLGLKQAKFGDIKTTLGGVGNKLSFMKKFIREPTGGRASGFIPARAEGYVPNFANEIEGAAGSEESAIFNKDILKRSEGISDETIPAASGFTPNYAEKLKGFGRDSMIKDKTIKGRRTLDVQYIRGFAGEGAGIFRNILKTLINADKSGRPYSDIDAGMVVGPRIPSVLVKGKQLLDRTRKTKKSPPLTRIKGTFNPSGLMMKLDSYKDDITADGSEYLSGEEKDLISSLKTLGVDPDEKRMVELEGLPFFKRGFASGHVPNFMDLFRGVKAPKGSSLTSKDIYKSDPRRARKFKASDVYDLNTLHDYLRSHVENEKTSSLISSSTNIKTAKDFATTKDPSKQGFVGKTSMSHKRMYNPRKVDKLVNFLMKRRGWSEAKSVQWFANQARKKPIGFHMKRWLDTDLFKKFAFEDEVAILNKSSFADKDQGMAIASSGLVPNFANSLEQSIVREKSVLSDQGSSAKVYVDQDKRLKGSKNPMGLLVANTRDEPLNGSQGVDRAISTGLNPKNHGKAMSGGYVPNYISGAGIVKTDFASPQIKQMAKETQKLAVATSEASSAIQEQTASSDGLIGKVFALEFALSTLTAGMDITTTGTQSTIAGLTGVSSVFPDLISKLGFAGKAIAVATVAAGIAFDVYKNLYDPQLQNLKLLEAEEKARTIATNALKQNLEKLDKFGSEAAKFSLSSSNGDIETSGKLLQNLFEQASEVGSINPKGFEDLINSIGDTDKFNEAMATFKQTPEAGLKLSNFASDFNGMVTEMNKQADENQLFGVFDKGYDFDVSVFENDIKSMSDSLTAGLSDEKMRQLSDSLKDFDPSVDSASRAFLSMQNSLGDFDQATRNWITQNEELSQAFVEQIKAQSSYSSAVIAAKEAFSRAASPVVALNKKMNNLSTALNVASESSERAFDALYKIGEIEIKSKSERMQATGTVTKENQIKGGSSAQIQNSLLKSSKATQTALTKFSSELIKESKDSGTVLSASLKTLVESIGAGGVSSSAALESLIQIQKTGTKEEKEKAEKTISELRAINASQISQQKAAEASAKAQLSALKSQQISTLRNTQFSEQQINALTTFGNDLKSDGETAKSSLEKITEMSNAIKALDSVGADSDILAELTESNSKLSEIENLRAAFSSVIGKNVEGESLAGIKASIDKFILEGGAGKLEAANAKFLNALQKPLNDAIARDEAGVKGEDEVRESQLIEITQESVDKLSAEMSNAIGQSIGKALGVGEAIAEAINKNLDAEGVSAEVSNLSKQNKINAQANTDHRAKLNNALMEALKESNFSGSASALQKAAKSLENAADKINKNNAAAGFVPSFSPMGEAVSRAMKTERALGGKPVVDHNKQVGTYVRDGNTQPNFSAVKRDHPEGIKSATKNSKIIQGGSNARGFVPSFAPNAVDKYDKDGINIKTGKPRWTEGKLTAGKVWDGLPDIFGAMVESGFDIGRDIVKDGDQLEILKEAYFGKKPFVKSSNSNSVFDRIREDNARNEFAGEIVSRKLQDQDYRKWKEGHPRISERMARKNKDDVKSLAFDEFYSFLKWTDNREILDNFGVGDNDYNEWGKTFDKAYPKMFEGEYGGKFYTSDSGEMTLNSGKFSKAGKQDPTKFNLLDVAKKAVSTGRLTTPIMKSTLSANHELEGEEYQNVIKMAVSKGLSDGRGRERGQFFHSQIEGQDYLSQMNGGADFIVDSIMSNKIDQAVNVEDKFKLPFSIERGERKSGLTGIKWNSSSKVWTRGDLDALSPDIDKVISENNKVIGAQRAQKTSEDLLSKETLEQLGSNYNPLLVADAEADNVYYSDLKKRVDNFKKWNDQSKGIDGVRSYVDPADTMNLINADGGDSSLTPFDHTSLGDKDLQGFTPFARAQSFVNKFLTKNKASEVNTRFVDDFFPKNITEMAQNILPEGGVNDSFNLAKDILLERSEDITKSPLQRGVDEMVKSGLISPEVGQSIKDKIKPKISDKAQKESDKLKKGFIGPRNIADPDDPDEEEPNIFERLEDRQRDALAGAEAAIAADKDIQVEAQKTDLQKERDLLYLGLLGKQAEDTRKSEGSTQIQERIQKVKDVLPKYPEYIDRLIEPRKRRAEEAAKLSEKFSGSPRQEKFNNIQKREEGLINLLQGRKALYQNPEHALAHLYYADATKFSKFEDTRAGASIWDSDPDYLNKFKLLKEKHGIGTGSEKELKNRGIESRDILELNPDLKNDPSANLFAQIQEQQGNRPSAFSRKFESSNEQERIKLMRSINARDARINNVDGGLPFGDSTSDVEISGLFRDENRLKLFKQAIAGTKNSEPEVSFLLEEMLRSGSNGLASEIMLQKIKDIGIPFMTTAPVGDFLENQKIDIAGQGGIKTPVKAVDSQSIDDLIHKMNLLQKEKYIKNNKAKLESEGIADSPKLIDLITGSKQNLLEYPVYLNSKSDGMIKKILESKLEKKESVANLEAWNKKYQDLGGLKELSRNEKDNNGGFYGDYEMSDYAKRPDPNYEEGEPIFQAVEKGEGFEELNPFARFGDDRMTSPSMAARNVIGTHYNHGINQDYEKFLSNDQHPFPDLGAPVGDRLAEFRSKALGISKKMKGLSYAPDGYTRNNQADSPTGRPDQITDLISTYGLLVPEEKVVAAGEAAGFVPNFSAIAGEVAASRMAGYKSPVKSSQVRTMNIPGQGKTAYNTQESVFKLPGMSQPFITPPSSSKAAKPYKNEVQKKFNFNPYKNTAADGFVPNFAGGLDSSGFEKSMTSFSSSVDGFERHVSSFDKAISSLDFREFAASSKQIFGAAQEFSKQSISMREAAVLFKEGSSSIAGSATTGSIDLSPMTSAASTINEGLTKLSDELGDPIEINSSAITQSMSQLTAALGNVRGSIDVKIPNINVDVNGASSISNSISSILKSQIPGIVNESINSQKQAIIEEVKRSIFG